MLPIKVLSANRLACAQSAPTPPSEQRGMDVLDKTPAHPHQQRHGNACCAIRSPIGGSFPQEAKHSTHYPTCGSRCRFAQHRRRLIAQRAPPHSPVFRPPWFSHTCRRCRGDDSRGLFRRSQECGGRDDRLPRRRRRRAWGRGTAGETAASAGSDGRRLLCPCS